VIPSRGPRASARYAACAAHLIEAVNNSVHSWLRAYKSVDRRADFCHQEEPFLTDARFQGIYRIPKIDVQVAGTYQTVPGPNLLANYRPRTTPTRPTPPCGRARPRS